LSLPSIKRLLKFKISSDEKKYNEIFTSLESLKGEMK